MKKGKELVSVKPAEVSLTAEVVALAKQTYFKDAPESVVQLALHLARRYGLDPLAREVMVVQRVKDDPKSWTPMVGRDGFLGIAHQNPLFNGMNSALIKDETGTITGATATVYRKDWAHPLVVTVEMKEYNLGYALWRSKPGTMIQKVAESQALRKAFRINGVYSEEEMEIATVVVEKALPTPTVSAEAPPPEDVGRPPAPAGTEPDARRITEDQGRRLHARRGKVNMDEQVLKDYLVVNAVEYGIDPGQPKLTPQIRARDFDRILAWVEGTGVK